MWKLIATLVGVILFTELPCVALEVAKVEPCDIKCDAHGLPLRRSMFSVSKPPPLKQQLFDLKALVIKSKDSPTDLRGSCNPLDGDKVDKEENDMT